MVRRGILPAPGVRFINKQDRHDVITMIKVQKCSVIDMERKMFFLVFHLK